MGGRGSRIVERVEYKTDPALVQRLDEMAKSNQEMNQQLLAMKEEQLRAIEEARGYKMQAEERQKMLNAMEDPMQYSNMKKANFENLLRNLQSHPVEASMPPEFKSKANVGFIGITSCGKSTLINTLAKREVAKTGMDETTKEITPVWALDSLQFWDFPGFNDRVDYFDIKFIAFVKAFSMMYVLYDNDLKVCLNLIRLLQALKVPFALVRTKCDNDENPWKTNLVAVESDLKAIREREAFSLSANGVHPLPKVYHVSCRNARISMKILDYKPEEVCGGLYDWHELVKDMLALKSAP
jgi:small GTP-binding protein